jgi:hypothetical protein
LGFIKLDTDTSKPKATVATGQVVITGLKYAYNECVDPSSMAFEAYQQNSLGYCDLDKSLSAVAKFTGTKVTKAADMTLKIDHSNSKSLGAAYSSSGGVVTVKVCVRARMTKGDLEIMFTENNFVVKHSTGGKFSSVTMKVDRKANIEVREDLEDSVKVTAYQCDSSHKKITSPAPIAQGKALLRICVKGVEAKYSCAGIPTATLKQSGNGFEDKMIDDGTVKSDFTEFIEVTKPKPLCVLAMYLPPKYFTKKTSSSSLQVVVEGSAAMSAARRQLKDVDDQSPDKKIRDFGRDRGDRR